MCNQPQSPFFWRLGIQLNENVSLQMTSPYPFTSITHFSYTLFNITFQQALIMSSICRTSPFESVTTTETITYQNERVNRATETTVRVAVMEY